jgi:NAD/NADP transhydrogenase alpha subunit
MLIGLTREPDGETRVAATPATVKQLIGLGYDVVVESGAGEFSSFAGPAYAEAGARPTPPKMHGALTSCCGSALRVGRMRGG